MTYPADELVAMAIPKTWTTRDIGYGTCRLLTLSGQSEQPIHGPFAFLAEQLAFELRQSFQSSP